jgi:hypothetical protein
MTMAGLLAGLDDTVGSVMAMAWANTANGSEGSNTMLASAYLTPQGSSGAGAGSVSGLIYGNLASNGWTLVGHYNEANQSNNSGDPQSFANTIFSSYGLVAHTTARVPMARYFRLKAVSGLTCADNPGGQGCGGGSSQIPEPGTLLLVGMGLLGLTRVTRRREAH